MVLQLILSQADIIAALQAFATQNGHNMNATVVPAIDTTNYTITIQLNT